jgi:hypothetical protein
MEDYIIHKALYLQTLGIGKAQASLTHIEYGVRVHLTHRSTMATLNIIGIYLELGKGLDATTTYGDVAVGLLRVGMLGIGGNVYQAREATM